MSFIRLMLAATIASALLVGVMPTAVSADTVAKQDQELEEEVKVECTAGGYGQSSTCKAKSRVLGKQSQEIKTRDGVKVLNKLENTGLDTPTLATVSSMLVLGTAAAYVKVKSKNA
jgi:opacity protein-like surface antigen